MRRVTKKMSCKIESNIKNIMLISERDVILCI